MMQREKAIVQLAKCLYTTLERLDPGFEEFVEWEDLPVIDGLLYVSCVRELLNHQDWLKAAMNNNEAA